jgi:hypothetical protein
MQMADVYIDLIDINADKVDFRLQQLQKLIASILAEKRNDPNFDVNNLPFLKAKFSASVTDSNSLKIGNVLEGNDQQTATTSHQIAASRQHVNSNHVVEPQLPASASALASLSNSQISASFTSSEPLNSSPSGDTSKKVDPTVQLLSQFMVKSHPLLLRVKHIEKQFKSLKSMLPKCDVETIIMRYPFILTLDLVTKVPEKVKMLKFLLDGDDNTAQVINSEPTILGKDVAKSVVQRLDKIRDFVDLPNEAIIAIVVRHPRILSLKNRDIGRLSVLKPVAPTNLVSIYKSGSSDSDQQQKQLQQQPQHPASSVTYSKEELMALVPKLVMMPNQAFKDLYPDWTYGNVSETDVMVDDHVDAEEASNASIVNEDEQVSSSNISKQDKESIDPISEIPYLQTRTQRAHAWYGDDVNK